MPPMTGIRIHTAHTSDLGPSELAAARALLDEVFEGDFADEDWEHSLGGTHALAWHGTELVGHASVVQRRLLYGDRALRTGYVEGVGVRAELRRQGVGAAMMAELERVLRGAFELGALCASEGAAEFYAARDWRLWEGPTRALTPDGVVATPEEDGAVFVLPVPGGPEPDLTAPLTCDYRNGDVW